MVKNKDVKMLVMTDHSKRSWQPLDKLLSVFRILVSIVFHDQRLCNVYGTLLMEFKSLCSCDWNLCLPLLLVRVVRPGRLT